MSFAAVLLAPFVMMFPADAAGPQDVPTAAIGQIPPEWIAAPPGGVALDEGGVFSQVVETFRVQSQNQVRIEQHMTIRIAPSRPTTLPPRFMLDMPRRELPARMIERNFGRCVSASSIAGVQPDSGDRLILYLRDRRMLSAQLDRACRARDFYSGFYMERTNDGQLCVDRDTLLSRSGANCKLTRIRQLVPDD
jgi:hypothetical protein